MRNLTALLFSGGLAFLLMVIAWQLTLGEAPMLIGSAILDNAAKDIGAANLVTSVVLGYRGIDTLGEIAILFGAATATSMVMSSYAAADNQNTPVSAREDGSILASSVRLLFPLLLTLGLYIIVHGHLTPGGGFQGGVILAAAFF
ncbi:MAG: MnhB domain-containing protein, partial [Mariprofundaceae bacterium]|nr:MnhB domain-containing protein [Mariprofundaceae bacterium]